MKHNKRNILYTTIAVIIIVVIGYFVAIASVFWISLFLALLLIVKIKRAGSNIIPTNHLS